ncbi:hypothetical protein JQ575_34525 [Bradyrhizobium sp. JYMT SZCCT0428]|nr:hypothetical protein [Bradyrhizobium sp. JYMT SZCCT0428]
MEAEVYKAIGRFIFWFSKLEGYLKAHIVGLLDLERDIFDAVVSPYDFSTMCKVLEKLMLAKKLAEPNALSKYFSKCRSINDQRVRVAHGDWTLTGARHVARGKLEAEIYFATPEDLNKHAATCQELIREFIRLVNRSDKGP